MPRPAVSRLLDAIDGPDAVKALSLEQLPQLAQELRDEIVAVTAANGGHVGPNLGVVELTLALHRVFDSRKDRFVFDVSHQGYPHKLLTGRHGEFFRKLRRTGGASGFLNRAESEHDAFGAGHAGTALSAALGMAVARDRRGTDDHVVAICGDAAFTCGITAEALNNISSATKRLIVVLNDNEWSIAKNVGALAEHFNSLSAKGGAADIFEHFGLRYVGPIDGHDLPAVIDALEKAKRSEVPVLLHVLTKKGHGFEAARQSPEKFHGLGAFHPETGETKKASPGTPPAYQDVFGQAMVRFARHSPRIVGITAAMPSGTSLSALAEQLPEQFFDVGIAEEHAVLFAAGLATEGMRPVCAIYSTFLQRAYDPIIHDVALQKLPVTFCMDRAGLSPNDGPTHHGLFDLAYLRCVPGVVVMQPKDEDELVDMLHTSLCLNGPAFVRYPRGAAMGVKIKERPAKLAVGQAEVLREGADIVIWSLGCFVAEAEKVAEQLSAENGLSVGVVNARWAKPIDRALLLAQAADTPLIVTMEDHVVTGGFGSAVLETLQEAKAPAALERIGWPDKFIEHGSSVEELRAAHGLSGPQIHARVLEAWRSLQVRPQRLTPRAEEVRPFRAAG